MFNLKRKKEKTKKTEVRNWDRYEVPPSIADCLLPLMEEQQRKDTWETLQPKLFGVLCVGLALAFIASLFSIAILSCIFCVAALSVYVYYGRKYDKLDDKSRKFIAKIKAFKFKKFIKDSFRILKEQGVKGLLQKVKQISIYCEPKQVHIDCSHGSIYNGHVDHGYDKEISKEQIEECEKATAELYKAIVRCEQGTHNDNLYIDDLCYA